MRTAILQYKEANSKDILTMGATVIPINHLDSNENHKSDTINREKYFRPSKLPILNNRNISFDFMYKYCKSKEGYKALPAAVFSTPEETTVNYFSVLRQAENLTANMYGGCGTVGNAKYPYPVACDFFTSEYKAKISFNQYFKSFEGTDEYDYLIEFIQLTNDTDLAIAQYRKKQGENWQYVVLDPQKCLE